MKVQIERNLFLESDGMQYILKEYTGTTDKNGKELYNAKGYYGDVQSAMRGLLKFKIMESTATTLNGLVEDMRRLKEYFESRIEF